MKTEKKWCHNCGVMRVNVYPVIAYEDTDAYNSLFHCKKCHDKEVYDINNPKVYKSSDLPF